MRAIYKNLQKGGLIMELKSKNTEKVPMEDKDIINLYWTRDERAIEETDFKYKKYLYTIAYNVLHDNLDCEECLNDTYLGAWNAIPPHRPNVLKAFLTAIARRTAIKRYQRNTSQKVIPSEMTVALSELEDFISSDNDVSAEIDAKQLGEIISSFIRSLNKRRRFIFMSRYYVADPISTIANNLSVSQSTVNKELATIKTLLKKVLESEGYSL